MMNLITSNQNSIIKTIKSLKTRKGREENGLFYIEGARSVEEVLNSGIDIVEVLISEEFMANPDNVDILDKMDAMNIKKYLVTDRLFKEITDTETPQGILSIIKMILSDCSDIKENEGLFVILDSIRDPGNMGTIIRTADAAGFSGVIISKGCVDVYNPKVLRSTMGSIFHIPVYQFENTIDAINFIKSKGIKVYTSHLDGNVEIFDVDMTKAISLVIGNEAEGVSPQVAGISDMLVRIPMPGKAESLNASVAAGILMYESVRQRGSLKR